jgi:hypothetical protein
MSAYPTDLTSREHKRILALLSTPEHQDEVRQSWPWREWTLRTFLFF